MGSSYPYDHQDKPTWGRNTSNRRSSNGIAKYWWVLLVAYIGLRYISAVIRHHARKDALQYEIRERLDDLEERQALEEVIAHQDVEIQRKREEAFEAERAAWREEYNRRNGQAAQD